MVKLKAVSLPTDFSEKSSEAQYHAVYRFIKSLGLVYRVSTTESQKDPRVTLAESVDFLQNMHPKLTQTCRHEDWIINMDQTPIPFTYNARKTLEVVGRRTVFVRKSTCDTKRDVHDDYHCVRKGVEPDANLQRKTGRKNLCLSRQCVDG
jgi:hypothetical protein